MNNFIILFSYELKKILKRKFVWITFIIIMLFLIFMTAVEFLTVYTIDGKSISGYEMMIEKRNYARKLEDRLIDNSLLNEMKDAYKNPSKDNKKKYRAIRDYVYNITEDSKDIYNITEEQLYQIRGKKLEALWNEQNLTKKETLYWNNKEQSINRPIKYGYAEGYLRILNEFLILNFFTFLLIVIGLSPVFSDEHLKKMDQLTLCTKNGKTIFFLAKIASGMFLGFISAFLLLGTVIISTLCIYGKDGFDVLVQVYLRNCSWNISMGQAVLIFGGVYLIASLLYSVTAMILSEIFKNSIAVMGIMMGTILLTLFLNIPYHFRVLSQIWGILPTVLLTIWQLFDARLTTVFGVHFTNFQIAPIAYSLFIILLIFIGNCLYKHYQISGR